MNQLLGVEPPQAEAEEKPSVDPRHLKAAQEWQRDHERIAKSHSEALEKRQRWMLANARATIGELMTAKGIQALDPKKFKKSHHQKGQS
jgi:hypothetical protein